MIISFSINETRGVESPYRVSNSGSRKRCECFVTHFTMKTYKKIVFDFMVKSDIECAKNLHTNCLSLTQSS